MAHVTVRLQVSDYNLTDQLEQNTAVYSAITFKEFVIAMINRVIGPFFCLFFCLFSKTKRLAFCDSGFSMEARVEVHFHG